MTMGMTITQKILAAHSAKVYQARPFPEFMQQLMGAGGLINYVRQRVMVGLTQEEGVVE
ncbi:MAG: hypothetical protein M1299_13080 [Firmicutes bacterium]|nr:hypothetical protein [Bacillota bacterium]